MYDGPYWVILLMYGFHDTRHRFPQVHGSQRDPRVLGRHIWPSLQANFWQSLNLMVILSLINLTFFYLQSINLFK